MDSKDNEIDLQVQLEEDARRYRKLRDLAVIHWYLEEKVAAASLDYINTNEEFNKAVDEM